MLEQCRSIGKPCEQALTQESVWAMFPQGLHALVAPDKLNLGVGLSTPGHHLQVTALPSKFDQAFTRAHCSMVASHESLGLNCDPVWKHMETATPCCQILDLLPDLADFKAVRPDVMLLTGLEAWPP